jgi:cyclic pyranopterin phosphate synthase
VNISLDSLNEKNFARITGHNKLSKVLRGIKAAREVGLKPIKINVVVLKGINDEEAVDLVKFSQRNSLIVRFIEYMPINGVGRREWYISNEIIKKMIEKRWGKLEPSFSVGSGPAKYFAIKGSSIPIGFISFISHPFCEECNRLRLTPEGKLRPCLISNFEVDIKNALRKENRQIHIKELFDLAVRYKSVRKEKIRKGEISHFDFDKTNRFMFQIGG